MTIVQEILDAERKADNVVKKAEAAKEQKIAAARQKVVSALTEGKTELESTSDKSIKAIMKKLEQRKDKIIATYQKQADDVQKNADVDAAVSYVLKVMEEDL